MLSCTVPELQLTIISPGPTPSFHQLKVLALLKVSSCWKGVFCPCCLFGSQTLSTFEPHRDNLDWIIWITCVTRLLVLPWLRCYPHFIYMGHSRPAERDILECHTLTFLLPLKPFMGQVIIFGLPSSPNWGWTTSQWGRGTTGFPSANHRRSAITMFSQSAAAESLWKSVKGKKGTKSSNILIN